MKNRIKNLFVAGLMLFSMGLSTVVKSAPAWGATKMVTYKSECDSLNGTVKTQVNGQYLCEYSSDSNVTTSTRISGSSESDVIQKCEARGGKIGSGGIKNVARGAYEGECIPASNTNLHTNDTVDPTSPTDDDRNGGGTDETSATDVKQNGEYTYNNGLQTEDTFQTSIIDCSDGTKGEGIFCLLNIGLTILTWGVGIAATVGIVITGIQYLTARDSVEQMTKAKSRLVNIIIGLVVYAVMWGFLNWLIPGGLF